MASGFAEQGRRSTEAKRHLASHRTARAAEAEHGSGDSTADVVFLTQYLPESCGLCADRALHLCPVIRFSASSGSASVVGDGSRPPIVGTASRDPLDIWENRYL